MKPGIEWSQNAKERRSHIVFHVGTAFPHWFCTGLQNVLYFDTKDAKFTLHELVGQNFAFESVHLERFPQLTIMQNIRSHTPFFRTTLLHKTI